MVTVEYPFPVKLPGETEKLRGFPVPAVDTEMV
jgi:hypothetical protein